MFSADTRAKCGGRGGPAPAWVGAKQLVVVAASPDPARLRRGRLDDLEIETYTWDVLPAAYKTGDITDYVSRELEWMSAALRTIAEQPV